MLHTNYRAAADRLGLTMTPSDPGFFSSSIELAGELEGHPVRVRRVIGMHQLDTEVYFQPAFDLGLDVAPAGQPSWASTINLRRIGRLFSHADMTIGDAELDDAFAIHGDEDARVRPLLEQSLEQAELVLQSIAGSLRPRPAYR